SSCRRILSTSSRFHSSGGTRASVFPASKRKLVLKIRTISTTCKATTYDAKAIQMPAPRNLDTDPPCSGVIVGLSPERIGDRGGKPDELQLHPIEKLVQPAPHDLIDRLAHHR